MNCLASILVVLVLAVPGQVAAQRVAAGDSVRIRTREGASFEARVAAVLPDSVELYQAAEARGYDFRSIDSLWVRREASRAGRGAAVGGFTLAVAFVIWCNLDADKGHPVEVCPSGAGTLAAGVVGAGLGALGGALVGSLIGVERWDLRFVAPL